MERIEVTSQNALEVAEAVLTHIAEPAHFTRIGAVATSLGYVYNGTAQKGDIGTFLRVAMWNDTNGDEKAAKSRFVRCANRVYRLRTQEAPAGFESRTLVPRKGKTPSTPANNFAAMPGASGGPRIEPVAAMVALALNKPIDDRTEKVAEEQANDQNKVAQEAALADMKAAEAETKAQIAANKAGNKVATK